ncbi:MAG: type IX secretion system membrane protein PorP/SprF [Haliscomenobacter sp.]|nr:type IX secretion system membrane protein PorP/SprF [Haliscomenobacter sp.]
MYKPLLVPFLLLAAGRLLAQDPFFTHFQGAESHFNPALTGIKGARSFGIKYKSQWAAAGIQPFQTGLLNFEESLPCLPFDYGIAMAFDQEGEGRLQTYDLGVKVAGAPAFLAGKGLFNLRLGINAQFSLKRVDFSRFVFSDQLDPKYGLTDPNGVPNPSSFTPPADSRSLPLFTPTVGFLVNYLSNTRSSRPVSIQLGAALHNAYSLGRPRNGNTESLLGIETDIPERYNAFLRTEFIPVHSGGNFASLSPQVFYQRQGGLSYWETGMRFGINRLAGIGLFYHASSDQSNGPSTRWMSLNLDFGSAVAGYKGRVEAGASFAWNKSGLKNFVGPVMEISMTYHWARSWICRDAGRGLDYTRGKNSPECPTWTFSNARRKMYENIWYKNAQ